MVYLIVIVVLTVAVSAFCSTLEAVVLSTTAVEIESLKKRAPRKGRLLEEMVENIDATTSAILTTNTIANTFGATLAGAQFAAIFKPEGVFAYIFPASMTIGILLFAEILPKNMGLIYRKAAQNRLTYPLWTLYRVMSPVAKFTSWLIGLLASKKPADSEENQDDEIIMLAKKGEEDGVISTQERDLIANSLTLDDVTISEIMTPRTVVVALDADATVAETFKAHPNLDFSRLPLYRDTIDNIVGIVRRRDILTAMADDKYDVKLSTFSQKPVFVPENGSALAVLRQLLKKHQQMGIVVDEFASLTGVVTLEDIFEHLLGSEIFENDDSAVDMRELARKKRNVKR